MFMRSVLLAVGVVFALAAPPLHAQQSGATLAARDWLANGASTALLAQPATAQEVTAFLSGLGQEGVQLCSQRFVDLDANGQYELVASVDYSGRNFCNTVLVVSRTARRPSGFALQVIHAWNVEHVDAILQPDPRNGRITLAVPQPLTDYDGTSCVATWPKLYQFAGGQLNDTSAAPQSGAFYRKLFEELQTQSGDSGFRQKTTPPAAPALAGNRSEDTDASCKLITLDKLARFLRLSPNAGFERAQQWMQSPDPGLRKKATRVLADIGSPAAKRHLAVLARDPDATVAQLARMQLTAVDKGNNQRNWGDQ